jgi:hypothetical protein
VSDDGLADDWQAGWLERAIGHEEHVRIARVLVRRHGREEARVRLLRGTRRNCDARGVPERFDEALTRAWSERVADAVETADGATYADFIGLHPELRASDLLGRPEWLEGS